jgi:hypothetical protein
VADFWERGDEPLGFVKAGTCSTTLQILCHAVTGLFSCVLPDLSCKYNVNLHFVCSVHYPESRHYIAVSYQINAHSPYMRYSYITPTCFHAIAPSSGSTPLGGHLPMRPSSSVVTHFRLWRLVVSGYACCSR